PACRCRHPLTTGNYTLSLHDALPIFIRKLFNVYRFGPPVGVTQPSTCPRVDHQVSRLPLPTLRPVKTRFRFGCAPEGLNRAQSRDRKSTRLNSSHVKISYAVFGLKKK